MEKIYADIESNLDKDLAALKQLVEVPSIATDRESTRKCAAVLSELMKRCGIDSRIIETPGNPVVYGEVTAATSKKTLLIYDHYDVQPVEPLSLWNTDPFEMVTKNGRIFGRGVSDDKGQLLSNIKGVESWLRVYGKTPVNIKFVFEGEEEIGSPNLESFICEHRDLLKTDLVFGCDTHINESGFPIVYIGNKGNLSVQLNVRTNQAEIHSQNSPNVLNAAWVLVDILKSLRTVEGDVSIKGFYDDVRTISPEELEAVKRIPFRKDDQINLARAVDQDNYYQNLIFKPSCNISGMSAGYTGEGSQAIIPERATAKLSFYLVPQQEPDNLLAKLRAHLDTNGFGSLVETVFLYATRPSRFPITHPYVGLVRQSVEEVWEKEALVIPNCPGANPGYVFLKHLGCNLILVPLALPDENAHAPNENLPVDSFLKGTKITANLIGKLGAPKD